MKYGRNMNERIKLLAEQAKMFATPMKFHLGGQDYARVRDEKLAELIIQECMACSIWVGKNNTNTVEPIHTAHAINQRIKQQFGIEE
jgi:hypothetical protein